MRHLSLSILAVLLIIPGVASARMPVVNISSGSVSARSAFGEGETLSQKRDVATVSVQKSAPTRTRSVVARSVSKQVSAPAGRSVDIGETLAATDVLVPHRPSGDLWAKSDNVLRMPMASEFSVIRSDSILPEESLDNAFSAVSTPVTETVRVASSVPQKTDVSDTVSDLDNQIARLVEMQKRIADSERNVSSRVIAAPIATMDTVPVAKPVRVASNRVAERPAAPVVEHNNEPDVPVVANNDFSLRRMVVPMSDDVVVRSVEKNTSPRIAAVRDDMTKMSPSELRRAFRKTFLSENKHLSTYSVDDRFDVASDMSASIEGFTSARDLSEQGGIRPLEIKIKFRNEDSALSRENYNLLTEYAGIVVSKPTRAIQVAIPQHMTTSKDGRKLAARRLAIVEQALTDNGVSQQRIVPVLSNREEQGFVLRIISGDQYETLTQQQHDIFGDTINKKTYKSMSW